jgi:hypothetical protein
MEGERRSEEAPLVDIDPVLNVFALANGLDLFRNQRGRADRVLEWYRDGMERRICITAEEGSASDGGSRWAVYVEASRRSGGVTTSARRDLERGAAFDEIRDRLRALLADGVERANEIDEKDLSANG